MKENILTQHVTSSGQALSGQHIPALKAQESPRLSSPFLPKATPPEHSRKPTSESLASCALLNPSQPESFRFRARPTPAVRARAEDLLAEREPFGSHPQPLRRAVRAQGRVRSRPGTDSLRFVRQPRAGSASVRGWSDPRGFNERLR